MATAPSSRHTRRSEFRKLICRISESLTKPNHDQIKYMRKLSSEKAGSNLDILEELEKRGEFSPYNTGPLVELLEDINRHDLSEEVRDAYQVIYPDVALTPAAQHSTPDHQVDHFQFDRGYFGQRSWPLPLHKKNVQHTRGGSVTVFIPPSPSLSLGVKINSSASSLNRSESTRRSGTYSVHSVISEHSASQAHYQLELVRGESDSGNSGLLLIRGPSVEQQPRATLPAHDDSYKRRGKSFNMANPAHVN